MNMKKTMAAIAAGAVAVSAMATTISAETLAGRTLTYNLVKEAKTTTYKITVKTEFVDIPLTDGQGAEIKILSAGDADTSVKIYGTYRDANLPVVQTTASTKNSSLDYNPSLLMAAADGTNKTIMLPVVASNSTNNKNMLWGGSQATEAVAGTAATSATATAVTLDKGASSGVTGTPAITLGASEANVPAGFTKADGNVTITYAADTTWKDAQGNDWKAAVGGLTNPEAGDKITFTYTAAKAATDPIPAQAAQPVHGNITVQVTYDGVESGKGIYINRGWGDDVKIEDANALITAGKLGATLAVKDAPVGGADVYVNGGSTVLVETPVGTDKITKAPYKSTLTNTFTDGLNSTITTGGYFGVTTNTGDAIQHVWADLDDGGITDDQVDPNAIRSVINDCINKYGDVSFVFNTAAAGIKTVDGVDVYADGAWEGDWQYTSFGRHYWDSTPGYVIDDTTYITNNWMGNNLFSGALVINNNLTLSLGDAQKFDWTQTSLTFSWDAIQDAALTKNQFANYIQNMVLRTSTTWYWDNFQVVLGETEVEEVESGAPVEGDVEDLPEDEPEDFEDEPEDEPEEEPEDEPEDEPVEVAPVVETNPGTGNAPVALAVIPVALAAAAVVAKKRG